MSKDMRVKNGNDDICSTAVDNLDDDLRCARQSGALARLAWRYQPFSRARLCRVAWRSLDTWHTGRFGWVVGYPRRMVLLSGACLSLSGSVCSSGHSRSAGTAGCAGAATNSIVVLLR